MNLDILTIAKNYLKAIKQGKGGNDLRMFFDEDAIQIEMPNKLNPNGGTSNVATILERAERGKKLLKSQRYTIKNEIVHENTVVFELLWTGVLAMPVATLKTGDTMKAHFAMFIDFKDGKIFRQRNYDCFESF